MQFAQKKILVPVICSIALIMVALTLWANIQVASQSAPESHQSVSIPTTSIPIAQEVVTAEPTASVPTPTPDKKPVVLPSTPIPTPQPAVIKSLSVSSSHIDTANAGSVTTLTYKNLAARTLYKIDLSKYQATGLSLSWPHTVAVKWTTETKNPQQKLVSVPIDTDGNVVEPVNYSGLQDFPTSKVVYVYTSASVSSLKISLINPSTTVPATYQVSSASGIYNSDSGAAYSSLHIVTRDEWGANPASWDNKSSDDIDAASRMVWYPVYYKAARIIIHHTASTLNPSNPAAAVRGFYLYHAYTRGWGDIGYNFLIDQNGTIYEGKSGGDETQGYHAFGAANRISIGIALIGDFTKVVPTAKAQTALEQLMAEKAAFYGFTLKYSDGGVSKWKDPSYTVFPHRNVYEWDYTKHSWFLDATACPGDAFVPLLPGVTKQAESYRQSGFSTIKAVTSEVSAVFAAPHELGTIVVVYNVPENTPESTMQSFIPAYSGISSYTISGNTITYHTDSTIVTHPNGDTEYLVVPMGWQGYDNEYKTFGSGNFMLNGPEDRSKTLLKIFKLDPRVKAADVKSYLTPQL